MSIIEQTPQYSLTYQDDGREEKLQLVVQLPGVESASELDVVVRPTHISIRVPGRYRLELPVDPPVLDRPELLRFVKKKAQLKAIFVVDEAAAAAAQRKPVGAGGTAPPATTEGRTANKATPGAAASAAANGTASARADGADGSTAGGLGLRTSKRGPSSSQVHDSFHDDLLPRPKEQPQQQAQQQPTGASGDKPGSAAASAASNGRASGPGQHAGGAAAGASGNGFHFVFPPAAGTAGAQGPHKVQAPQQSTAAQHHSAPPPQQQQQQQPAPAKPAAAGGASANGSAFAGAPSAQPADLYQNAKHRANAEAAAQWLERALSAARGGDAARAELLLGRATGLVSDDKAAAALLANYNARCDPQHRMPRSVGVDAEDFVGASGGSASSASASPRQQQPRAQAQGTDAKGRPSQPYSFTKPEPERFVPNPGGSGDRAAGATRAATGAGTGTRPSGTAGQEPQAGRGGPAEAQAQGQAKGGKSQARGGASNRPGAAEAKPEPAGGGGSKAGTQQQQQQQQGANTRGAGAGFRPDPKARGPPPRARGAGSGGGAGSDADHGASPERDDGGGSAGGRGGAGGASAPVDRKWDWWFTGTMEALKAALEPYAGPGVLGNVVHGLFYVVYISLTVPHITISFLAALLHWLYEVAGYPEESRGLERYCAKYARWMIGCALATGLPLALLTYMCSFYIWQLGRLVTIFLLFPPMWLAALQTVGLYVLMPNTLKAPLLATLAPVPLLLSIAGTLMWRLVGLAVYYTGHLLAPGRTRAAAFAAAALQSCRSLAWYQAFPAVLLSFIIWLMLAASEANDPSKTKASGGGARKSGAAAGSDDEADGARHGRHGGHGGLHDMASGGRLAPEHVKGATGEIARVLGARDYFAVLGLSSEEAGSLTDEAVKSAYRRTQLRVHPDKAGPDAPGAEQASKRVNEAYTRLQTEAGRKQLLEAMRPSPFGGGAGTTGRGGSTGGAGPSAAGFSPDAFSSFEMPCWGCHGVHEAKVFSTDCSRARYCNECKAHHPAYEHEVWVWEDPNAFLFPERKMLLCVRNMVLDITDMATCCGMFTDAYGKRLRGNTHFVQYRLGGEPPGKGGGGNGSGGGTFRGRGDKAGGKGRKGKRK
ncbi:hypothetical protein HYH02_005094 [Chlamydomonas schloesseri]|uniref:J domain-containing protein n=1 Tax=Chlamydomonas schloesseri TaxID=2026947 RepID=A0A835WLE4_9CHLO|nr:hypothetical protein HYH02_005094 [Chlamydomonas schloesseri]|eukprot:KAG2449561.1 hypothetical protein HYH02_005094 [Chlamydomonas schloesseri]